MLRGALGPAGDLEVVSRRLDLSWRISRGEVAGVSHPLARHSLRGQRQNSRRCWRLPLDPSTGGTGAAVDARCFHAGSRFDLRDRRPNRDPSNEVSAEPGCAVLLLPLLGAAPAAVQKKWADEWNFAAEGATQVSAIASILVGPWGWSRPWLWPSVPTGFFPSGCAGQCLSGPFSVVRACPPGAGRMLTASRSARFSGCLSCLRARAEP